MFSSIPQAKISRLSSTLSTNYHVPNVLPDSSTHARPTSTVKPNSGLECSHLVESGERT